MRLGIFGGSFDPPHVGHLLMAQDAIAALSLDRLLIVPAAQQPLKQQHASATDRLAMTQRCFGGIPAISVDPIEIERGGLSFMVDTVGTLQQRWPLTELYLLVGQDVLATFPRWREPERLVRGAGGHATDRCRGCCRYRHRTAPSRDSRFSIWRFVRWMSSAEIRARVRAGRFIRGFVTDAVAEYIASAGLYLRDLVADDVAERA
jgi:nicotinate-nucleotide adenylyltransferase